MPEPLAHYGFIPWMRQGLASKITEKDTLGTGSGSASERAKINVEVILKDKEVETGIENEHGILKEVNLYGPGDVKGIQNRAILRVEPRKHVRNFEPNLLPYIEFYEEDFPWRYTPASPATSGSDTRKLRPWIALVVLKEDEFTLNPNNNGLSSFTLEDDKINQAFYNHKDIWAWAHVHLNNELGASGGEALKSEVNAELSNDPDSGISRIICPRKLQKSTAYKAFLIPTFETGRLGGLGLPTSGIKAQEPSWQMNGGNISTSEKKKNTFPFYFHWDFATGDLGDFESLVSILEPVVIKPESGTLPMDIQDPGYSLQGVANSKVVGVEGSLKPPDFVSEVFPNGSGDIKFQNKLKEIVNLAFDYSKSSTVSTDNPFYNAPFVEDPVIVPPTYGYWHALIERLGESGNPKWIDEINLDPKYRGVAGLGTKVIQKLQEKLMHRAWQQVGDIKEANQKIKESEMAKKVGTGIFKKHVFNATGSESAMITRATHRYLLNSEVNLTVNALINQSKVPLAAKSAAFRRVLRPGKKSNKTINKAINKAVKPQLHRNLITNFNLEENLENINSTQVVTAAKIKVSPITSISFGEVDSAITQLSQEYLNNKYYLAKDIIFNVISDLSPDNLNDLTPLQEAIELQDGSTTARQEAKILAKEGINALEKSTYTKTNNEISVKMGVAKFKEIFGENDTKKDIPTSKTYRNVTINRDPDVDGKDWTSKSTTLNEIQHFMSELNGLMLKTQEEKFITVEKMQKPVIGNIDKFYGDIKLRLQPNLNIDRKLRTQINLFHNNNKPIKPIMAHPKFDDAMYEEVKAISQDFIIPNIEFLPANSLSLLQTNQKFIESFMVGLNHEMSRELLWREYPTDQRGSYFRQFWNAEDNVLAENNNNYDIKELHKWKNSLGNHAVSTPSSGYLVLVVRGQLLLKFPDTIVYAQKAKYHSTKPTKEREMTTEINSVNTKFPAFSAKLEPDVQLFGFPLTMEQARGERATSDNQATSLMNPGWYFAFKERPGQIKFGLDDYVDDLGNDVMPAGNPETWNDLSWEHLVSNRNDLLNYHLNFEKAINLAINSPNEPAWGDNSADIASILYQNPVIFARHAQEMLPEE